MPADLWSLYPLMLKSRLFEEATAQLWRDGLISGELHLGTGEEGRHRRCGVSIAATATRWRWTIAAARR